LQSGVLQDFTWSSKWGVYEDGEEVVKEINFNGDNGGIFMRGKPNDVGKEKFKNGNYIWGTTDGSYYKDSFGNQVYFSPGDIEVKGNPGMRCGFSVFKSENSFNVRGAVKRDEILVQVINQNDVVLDFRGSKDISGNTVSIGESNRFNDNGKTKIEIPVVISSPNIRNVRIISLNEYDAKFSMSGSEGVQGIVDTSTRNTLLILGEKRMVETNKGGASYSGSQGGPVRVGQGFYAGGSSQDSSRGGSQGSGYSQGVRAVQDQMGARAPSPAPYRQCPGGDCSQCPNPNPQGCFGGYCPNGQCGF